MLKKSRKLLSILLAAILLFSAFAPMALAADEEKYPVIYISGYGSSLYKEKGNVNSQVIYPTGADVGAIVKEAIAPCLKELAIAIATDDYDKYCDELYNSIHPIYEDLVLAPDGMPKDGSGCGDNPDSISLSYKRFSNGEDGFPYDWRLSPEYSAAELDKFVDTMLSKTGASKVKIVGRCLGGNVLSAYLQNYSENAKAKVDEAVLFIPSTEGIQLFGSLFAGKIDIVPERLDEYVEELMKYEAIIDDPAVADFLQVLISILEQIKALDLVEGAFEKLLEKIGSNLIPRIIRRSYGSFPSFWAMVPAKDLEEALDFVYNTPELKEEYAGTIAKARSFRDNVQLNSSETIQRLSSEIGISVISKYNIPLMPIFEESYKNSDGTAETVFTSLGATAADFGKTLSADYIASMPEENKKYLSPDEQIDASTCALPDRTWFVKNSYHDHFPASIDRLIEAILVTDMDVFSNAEYPQFLEDTGADKLSPVEGKDPVKPDDNSIEGLIDLLKRFITSLIALFSKLFEGAQK